MLANTLRNKLLSSGFLHTFAANFLTNMLAFGSVLVVAYFLTPADVADIRIMQAYAIIGTTLASLGYTTGLLKACAEGDDKAAEEGYLKRATGHTFVTSLAYIALLLGLTQTGIIALSTDTLKTYLPYMLLMVPLSVVIENMRNFLIAKKAFKEAANAQINVRILTFFMVVGATYVWGISGFVLATVAAYGFGVLRFVKEVGTGFLRRVAIPFPSYFVSFSLFAMLGNLFVIISNYGDMFMLDMNIADRSTLGAYALASVLLGGMMVVTTSVQTILLPDMIKNQKDLVWMRKHFVDKQLKLTGMSVALAVIAVMGVSIAFPLVYGDDYALTPLLFAGLCINYVLVSAGTLGGSVLIGQGKTHINTKVAGVALLAGFVFAYLAIATCGIWGMVYGKILYALIICMATNALVLKTLKQQKQDG